MIEKIFIERYDTTTKKRDYEMEIKVGDKFRSKKELVLLTIKEINKEKDELIMQVADTEFFTDGPLSNFDGFSENVELEKITDEQFNEYLKTYSEDIKALIESRK